MKILIVAITMSAMTSLAYAGNLCSANVYSKADAQQGKIAFDSHCAYCHQYSMAGRVPGNYLKETPDLKVLSESDLKFIDNDAGVVPPLVGDKFFKKWMGKTFVDFSTSVSGAANSFPPANFQQPKSYFLITAYVLARNCGRM